MSPDHRKKLKHIEPKKKKIEISEEDKEIIEKYSENKEISISPEQKTILEMLTKRKTIEMLMIELNIMLRTLGKELIKKEKLLEILKDLKYKNFLKSITGTDGNEYWVDINYF